MKFEKFFLFLLIFNLSFLTTTLRVSLGFDYQIFNTFPQSCTIFTVSIGNTTYFCNNEDFDLDNSYIWFIPSQVYNSSSGPKQTYGAAFFGFDNNDHYADGYVQGGMNEKGLCFDGNGLPLYNLNPHPELPETHPFYHISLEIPWICSNISEAVNFYQTYNFGNFIACQNHYADANGNAVVVSGGPDGEFAFTGIEDNNYLISTNFNLADPTNGWYPCSRYTTADSMLSMIQTENELTVYACNRILKDVSQISTRYSYICNPISRDIYVYHDRQFDHGIKMNIDEELENVGTGVCGEPTTLGLNIWSYGNISSKAIRIADLFSSTANTPSHDLYSLLIVILNILGTISFAAITIVGSIFLIEFFKRKRTK